MPYSTLQPSLQPSLQLEILIKYNFFNTLQYLQYFFYILHVNIKIKKNLFMEKPTHVDIFLL